MSAEGIDTPVEPTEEQKRAKAWILVKDVLQNEEQYNALKQGYPVTLMGSNKIQYIVYPNGHLVKLTTNKPVLGRMKYGSKYINIDYLATIIAWIKFDAETLEKNWKCGQITLQENNTNQNDRLDGDFWAHRMLEHQEEVDGLIRHQIRGHRYLGHDYGIYDLVDDSREELEEKQRKYYDYSLILLVLSWITGILSIIALGIIPHIVVVIGSYTFLYLHKKYSELLNDEYEVRYNTKCFLLYWPLASIIPSFWFFLGTYALLLTF